MNKKIRKAESLTAVHTSNLSEKGITLIALVVTIVVLLILAGISINLVLGDNGIITKAKQAASATEEASAKNDMELFLTGLRMDKELGASFRLADYLSSNIGNEGIEDFLNNGDGTAQVAYKGNKYSVNLEDYTFEYLGKTDGIGVNRHIKQVLNNNNEDVPGIAMVEAGELETEDLGWKVLSINKDGTVNLIANNNTGFEVSLSGINGYTNGAKALNEICSKLYGNLEINGVKVLSARSVNAEDFYNIKYTSNGRVYENSKKIQPYINTLDVANNGYSTEQISEYIDVSNTSAMQASNTNMLLANTNPTLRNQNRTNKETVNMISTGNNYWLATRYGYSTHDNTNGTTPYTEDLSYEVYQMNYVRTDGVFTSATLFQTAKNYSTTGSNSTYNCALRPVITVSADSVPYKTIGSSVNTDPFYKGKSGAEAHGYVKADSIASLLGVDIKSVNKINSGLPTKEADMTWTKLENGGYDSLTGEFDTEHYDYYIADRTTNLQMRLTGAAAYNNGVLAMDTVCKNLYGNLTEIKLSNGKTKKVNVVVARNAKFEDFVDDSKLSGSYGGVWSTNANDSTAPNKITSTNNRYAPTLFTQYEGGDNLDTSNPSKGYSDAKISSYILSNAGTSSFVSNDQKNSYAYEKYDADPGLKVIYNAYWGGANRNTARINIGREYWLSSRCVYANWYYSNFCLRFVSGGSITTSNVFLSGPYTYSFCRSLRPVLQVSK